MDLSKYFNALNHELLVKTEKGSPQGGALSLLLVNARKGYWTIAGSSVLTTANIDERLARAGYYGILDRYKPLCAYD